MVDFHTMCLEGCQGCSSFQNQSLKQREREREITKCYDLDTNELYKEISISNQFCISAICLPKVTLGINELMVSM